MAVIYNDKVCIYANELIMYDPKRKVGSEKGFLPRGTYDSKVNRKQIIIARRSIPNSPALVEFDSLEVYIQQLYIKYYGDPHEDVERAATSPLERAVGYNEAAYSFFTTYRDGAGKPLRPEKVTLTHSRHVSWMQSSGCVTAMRNAVSDVAAPVSTYGTG